MFQYLSFIINKKNFMQRALQKNVLLISLLIILNFFFAHLYSSWERSLNENTNGLVRQYLNGTRYNSQHIK
jgi:hypothetical protein